MPPGARLEGALGASARPESLRQPRWVLDGVCSFAGWIFTGPRSRPSALGSKGCGPQLATLSWERLSVRSLSSKPSLLSTTLHGPELRGRGQEGLWQCHGRPCTETPGRSQAIGDDISSFSHLSGLLAVAAPSDRSSARSYARRRPGSWRGSPSPWDFLGIHPCPRWCGPYYRAPGPCPAAC